MKTHIGLAISLALLFGPAAMGPAQVAAAGPPVVTDTDPNDGDVSVATSRDVTVDFDITMDPVSTANSFSISPAVAGTIAVSGGRLVWNHTAPLAAGTTYHVTISTEARSTTGVPLAADHTFSFTTVVSPIFRVAGVAYGLQNQLVTGVKVLAYVAGGGVFSQTATGISGTFGLWLPAGSYHLTAEYPGGSMVTTGDMAVDRDMVIDFHEQDAPPRPFSGIPTWQFGLVAAGVAAAIVIGILVFLRYRKRKRLSVPPPPDFFDKH